MSNKDNFKAIFGVDQQKEKYEMKGHTFNKMVSSKPVCSNCGLIGLNNDFTRWCIDKGCYADLHPQYNAVKKKFTKF